MPGERSPSTDVALLFEVEGFSSKFSSTICLMGGGSFTVASSMSKDEGFSSGRTETWFLGRSKKWDF